MARIESFYFREQWQRMGENKGSPIRRYKIGNKSLDEWWIVLLRQQKISGQRKVPRGQWSIDDDEVYIGKTKVLLNFEINLVIMPLPT